jgi:hypothetical protein
VERETRTAVIDAHRDDRLFGTSQATWDPSGWRLSRPDARCSPRPSPTP